MRSSFIATLFVGALASPALNRAEQKILGEQQQQQQQPSFCNEAKALIAQDSQAATAYCSAYLDLPVITVQKTISRVTKTFTKITSTKTYLDYPVTTKVAKTITHSSTVLGRATTTITTTTSTETYTNPLSTCPIARQNDCSSKLNNKNSLRSSRPACLSKYISPPQISQACSCLSLPLSSTTTTFHQHPTGHPTGQGETAILLPLPTQTITLLTAAKITRTLTRTLTTGTVTVTPTFAGSLATTKTVYAAATETLILDGPFRLASAKDYDFLSSSSSSSSRKRNGVEWVHVNSTAMREGRSKNDGKAIWKADYDEEECLSSKTTPPTWFALNGQTLVTQNFGIENQFPRYELLGNVKIVPGEGVAGVYFSLPDSSRSNRDDDKEKNGQEFDVEGVEGKRVPLRCSFGREKSWNHYQEEEEEEEEAQMNLHEACPLTCRYVGGAGSRNSKREGGQWFVGYGGEDGKDGEEEEEYESFTMYAYRYGGLGS